MGLPDEDAASDAARPPAGKSPRNGGQPPNPEALEGRLPGQASASTGSRSEDPASWISSS